MQDVDAGAEGGAAVGSARAAGGTAGLDRDTAIGPSRRLDQLGVAREASSLFCDVRARHSTARVRLSGELGAGTVAELGAELVALIRTRHHQLIIDLYGLSHVSPICVGVLNRAVAELGALGGELTLTGISDADAGVLRHAGLHEAIRITVAPHPSPTASRDTTAGTAPATARQSTSEQKVVAEGGIS